MNIGDGLFNWKIVDKKNYGFECECKCGRVQWIAKNKLANGRSKMCRVCSNRKKSIDNIKHGHATRKSRSSIYGIWGLMIRRCTNINDPEYGNYGGRGIKVSEDWNHFQNFLKDMGPRPDGMIIDRIDVNKGYELSNCRWVSLRDSSRNTRRNIFYNIDGVRIIQADLINDLKTTHTTFKKYINLYGISETILRLKKKSK